MHAGSHAKAGAFKHTDTDTHTHTSTAELCEDGEFNVSTLTDTGVSTYVAPISPPIRTAWA